MAIFITVPLIVTIVAVFVRENDIINNSSTIPAIFIPLLLSVPFTILAATILYNAQKGIIKDNNKFNKYKIPPKNILMRLKLFKDNNDANWFLIIPYLIAWNISLLIVLLYGIYSFGVPGLKILLTNTWFVCGTLTYMPILILYYAIIRQMILDNNKNRKPTFIMEKTKQDSIDNPEQEKETRSNDSNSNDE